MSAVSNITSNAAQEKRPTLTSAAKPELLYDYFGFPEEAYSLKYNAPGSPQLAGRVAELLRYAYVDTSSIHTAFLCVTQAYGYCSLDF